MSAEFRPWPKTPRLFRDVVITEKIDGTNSAIIIAEATDVSDDRFAYIDIDDVTYAVGAQSRNRLITPGKATDNYGFAGWVQRNAAELVRLLGEGHHYGEWWGQGVARKYDMPEKRFSLFNVHRHEGIDFESKGLLHTVPILYRGPFDEDAIRGLITGLNRFGSVAAPGFKNPEGICVFHTASNQVFKVLCENDDLPKALAA